MRTLVDRIRCAIGWPRLVPFAGVSNLLICASCAHTRPEHYRHRMDLP